jgi:chromosome segregation ATPase
MDTESTEGGKLSVTLPPPLEEWVDERAELLGVDREELLVQVLSAYRATADLDGNIASPADDADVEERVREELDDRLDRRDRDVETVQQRVDDLEDDLEEDLEALRSRVIQLRDALRNRAMEDHTHEEIPDLTDRVDDLASDLGDPSMSVAELEDSLAAAETKLDTLAGVVVRLQRRDADDGTESDRALDRLRRAANRKGVTDASCPDCEQSVSVPLLTDPACPHCGAEVRDVTTTGIILTRAKLTGPESSEEGSDE